VQREQDDEELGQVAERRLQDSRHGRAEPRADLLRRERHDERQRGQRQAGHHEGEDVGRAAVGRGARRRGPEDGQEHGQPLSARQ
jgi:hypothetical protein